MIVTVEAVVADHGTIVVFEGTTEAGGTVTFGVDHRLAQHLADALADEAFVQAEVEDWAILGVKPA